MFFFSYLRYLEGAFKRYKIEFIFGEGMEKSVAAATLLMATVERIIRRTTQRTDSSPDKTKVIRSDLVS